MSQAYEHLSIEKKWQDIWNAEQAFKADDSDLSKPNSTA